MHDEAWVARCTLQCVQRQVEAGVRGKAVRSTAHLKSIMPAKSAISFSVV